MLVFIYFRFKSKSSKFDVGSFDQTPKNIIEQIHIPLNFAPSGYLMEKISGVKPKKSRLRHESGPESHDPVAKLSEKRLEYYQILPTPYSDNYW